VNTGISTIGPIDEALRPCGYGATAVHVYRRPKVVAAVRRLERQPRGTHADELETSIMLVLAPRLVDQTAARPWADREFRPGPLTRDPDHPNYSPDGVYGDPTLATVEKGRAVLEVMVADLLDVVRGLADD